MINEIKQLEDNIIKVQVLALDFLILVPYMFVRLKLVIEGQKNILIS
jgi:hypothetical protein